MPVRFPGRDGWLFLSGPPGGPLFLCVVRAPAPAAGESAEAHLERAIRASDPGATLVGSGAASVGGESLPARLFATGQGHPATCAVGAAVLLAIEGSAEPALLLFGRGGKADSVADPSAVGTHDPLRATLASFRRLDAQDQPIAPRQAPPEPDPERPARPALAPDPREVWERGEPVEERPRPDPPHVPIPLVEAPRPAAEETPVVTALTLLGKLRFELVSSGCWLETVPMTGNVVDSYLYALRSSLAPLEDALGRLAATGVASAPGLGQTFTHFRGALEGDPRTARIAPLLAQLESVLA